MARRNTLVFVMACMLGAPQLASSHTWVEQLNRVASNGTLVGPAGFSNGWTGRLNGFSDTKYTNRIPNDGFSMCKDGLQGAQSSEFPLLTAAPGDFVSMRYQENGHVTKPGTPLGKPLNRGTIFIYGTTDPKAADTLFDIHRQWTADGKGGDGRGRLLATRNYDDGQCYQLNDSPISKDRQSEFAHNTAQPMGPDVWCQSAVQLPEDVAQNSEYTLYWVWSWPTLKTDAAANSKNGQYADFPSGFKGDSRAVTSDDVITAEIYTSCSTINVQGEALVKSGKSALTSNKAANQNAGTFSAFDFPTNTNYNENAVKEQLQNPFLVDVEGSAPDNSAPGNGNANNNTEKLLPSSTPLVTPTPTGDGIRYITVTAPPIILYSMLTVTINPQATPTPSQDPDEDFDDVAPAIITPFLKNGLKVPKGRHIRGKDSWDFNKRI